MEGQLMEFRFKPGDVVLISGLPVEDDPFEGVKAEVVRALDEDTFWGKGGVPAYEVQALDMEPMETLFDVYDTWLEVGRGIVFEHEMKGAE